MTEAETHLIETIVDIAVSRAYEGALGAHGRIVTRGDFARMREALRRDIALAFDSVKESALAMREDGKSKTP